VVYLEHNTPKGDVPNTCHPVALSRYGMARFLTEWDAVLKEVSA
jgi:hypothetical protein